MTWFWVFVGFAVVVGGLAAFLSIDENNNMYFILYLVGLFLGAVIFTTLIPSSEDLAKKYNVDYATAEVIHEVTDIPESTIIEMIYYLELNDADLQSVFNLNDEEMTAIRILIEKRIKILDDKD